MHVTFTFKLSLYDKVGRCEALAIDSFPLNLCQAYTDIWVQSHILTKAIQYFDHAQSLYFP